MAYLLLKLKLSLKFEEIYQINILNSSSHRFERLAAVKALPDRNREMKKVAIIECYLR